MIFLWSSSFIRKTGKKNKNENKYNRKCENVFVFFFYKMLILLWPLKQKSLSELVSVVTYTIVSYVWNYLHSSLEQKIKQKNVSLRLSNNPLKLVTECKFKCRLKLLPTKWIEMLMSGSFLHWILLAKNDNAHLKTHNTFSSWAPWSSTFCAHSFM